MAFESARQTEWPLLTIHVDLDVGAEAYVMLSECSTVINGHYYLFPLIKFIFPLIKFKKLISKKKKKTKLISEKQKCNFYNVGYCKNWNKGCKFIHPAEACQSDNCDSKSCPKRHQKECKYFRKFCKHGVNCQFKHFEKKDISKKDNLDEEIKALQENMKEIDVIIKDLDSSISLLEEKIKEYEESKIMSDVSLSNAKKEIDKKDLEIISKTNTIKEQAEKIAESNIKVK